MKPSLGEDDGSVDFSKDDGKTVITAMTTAVVIVFVRGLAIVTVRMMRIRMSTMLAMSTLSL